MRLRQLPHLLRHARRRPTAAGLAPASRMLRLAAAAPWRVGMHRRRMLSCSALLKVSKSKCHSPSAVCSAINRLLSTMLALIQACWSGAGSPREEVDSMEWSGSGEDPAPEADPTSDPKCAPTAACEAAVQTVKALPASDEAHKGQGQVQHAEPRPTLLTVPATIQRLLHVCHLS